MKDRITLGHDADVAETAALTLADNCATERIFAALDWEREEKSRKRWEEMGISKQAFYCKLKKVCDLIEMPVNRGRKRLLDIGGERVSG